MTTGVVLEMYSKCLFGRKPAYLPECRKSSMCKNEDTNMQKKIDGCRSKLPQLKKSCDWVIS